MYRDTFKHSLTLLLLLLMASCSTVEDDFYQKSQVSKKQIDSYNLPKHAINDVVKGLAFQMLESSNFVNKKSPIAVTSFVTLDDLESTNWLGNQIAENFVHELQHHGLLVIDFKTTGHIRVTQEGDYALSRDWQELPARQIIDYIVTGTMMEQDNGILVNARMIGVKSKVVAATAQSFIPRWVLGDETQQNHQIKVKNGMISRDSSVLVEEERGVKIKE
ncbi:MAG: FlgO family outer membrane protein [Colwellia sp.]